MPREISAQLDGGGLRVALAVSRFNSQITEQLVAGALDGLHRHGVADEAITLVRCPGAWELPAVCTRLVASGGYDAVIALGCVIRGDTPHFEHVAAECCKGVAQAGLGEVPVIFGVLTTDTVDQAQNRAGIKHGNKGFDAAMSAIEMARLYKAI